METVTGLGWGTSFLSGESIGVASVSWRDEEGYGHTASALLELPDWGPLPPLECNWCGTAPERELWMREILGAFLMQTGVAQALPCSQYSRGESSRVKLTGVIYWLRMRCGWS